MAHGIHWFPHCFVDAKQLSQNLVFFPFFSKILEEFNIKLPLVVFNLFLESNGYIEVFVRVKLKARSMHCFFSLADHMLDDKHPSETTSVIR